MNTIIRIIPQVAASIRDSTFHQITLVRVQKGWLADKCVPSDIYR